MKITKAVVTSASRNQRGLPLPALVDRDGVQKAACRSSSRRRPPPGSSTFASSSAPGTRRPTRRRRGRGRRCSRSSSSASPPATGTPCTAPREFTADDPFLHFVNDHLYVSQQSGGRRCADSSSRSPPHRTAPSRPSSPRASTSCRTTASSGAARAQRGPPLRGRDRRREADADRGRAAADRPGAAGRALPRLLRHPRAHPRRHGDPRRADPPVAKLRPSPRAPASPSSSPPPSRPSRRASIPRGSRSRASATTSASSTACSWPRWPSPSTAPTATR